jgi:uroporphyrinogen-III synthase
MNAAMPSALPGLAQRQASEADLVPVLVTRPEPGASETADRLAALGRRAILAPLLRIEPRTGRLPDPKRLAAILATSTNAIGGLPPACHAVPLLAVGNATAKRARSAGFTTVESADGDALALAALVASRLRPEKGPLLLASGARQGMALAAALRADGYRVIRRVAYAACAATSLPDGAAGLLTAAQPHVALFFSAETAQTYVRLVIQAGLAEAVGNCEAVAIGPAASMALQTLPWRRVHVATKPNQDDMLALLT